MKEDKEIIKGEIGNVCCYPAFEIIIQGEMIEKVKKTLLSLNYPIK